MKDWLFFPLALALALVTIAAAALPGKDRVGCTSVSGAGTNYNEVIVTGEALCRLNATGEAEIQRIETSGKLQAIEISSQVGGLSNRPDRNPHFPLAADLEVQFAGRRIEITIEAKPADDFGATSFEANYSTGADGDSGWQTFRLKPDFDTYTFTWDVPARTVSESALDYLAIRPVVPDKSRAVVIRSVKFKRLPKSNPAP